MKKLDDRPPESKRIGLNVHDSIKQFQSAIDGLSVLNGRSLSIELTDKVRAGDGGVNNFAKDVSSGYIGVCGMSRFDKLSDPETGQVRRNIVEEAGYKYIRPFETVGDLTFTRIMVCIYHEYGHYVQHFDGEMNVDLAVSEVSIVNNKGYYHDEWERLPHEIDAEMYGVNAAWNTMRRLCPDAADVCMLDYVNFRSENESYVLPVKQGGYHSREEVMLAFDEAMDRSLNEPRPGKHNFLYHRGDDAIRLLMQDKWRRWSESPNAYYIDKLIDGGMTGRERDRMMASLVLYLHPDLLNENPVLRKADISVDKELL